MRQTNRHHLFDQYSTHIDVEKKLTGLRRHNSLPQIVSDQLNAYNNGLIGKGILDVSFA